MRTLLSSLGLALMVGCAGTAERAALHDASGASPLRTDKGADAHVTTTSRKPRAASRGGEGSLGRYVALAMEDSPQLKGAFERWRSSVLQISQARKLPDPQISFGYFIQSVETRVGPQRAKLSLQQSFPWPTKLTASADAAAASARAQQNRLEALTLSIKQRVEVAYWKLWLIRETRRIHTEHLQVVRSLSESVLARLATGAATLADQQQVDLTAARLEDMLRGMDEAETTAIAELHAATGSELPRLTETAPPEPTLPDESEERLRQAVKAHPFIESFGQMAESSEQMARAKNAERYPNFSLGADWIIVGEARMPGVADSGKDAFMLGGGLTIPLWQGIYSDRVAAARADASAHRAEQAAAEDHALAELEAALSSVRDAVRRAHLYESTLVPQADSAYSSVLGAYATGRGTVAQTLLAQRDLLELRSELEKARADYALGWARLESVVGKSVAPAVSEKKSHPEISNE